MKAEPPVMLERVIKLPAVPLTVNVVTVIVELAWNLMECGGVSHLKSAKVAEPPPPSKSNDPVPVPESQILLNVFVPPLNDFDAEVAFVSFIVELFGVMVNPLVVTEVHTLPEPVNVNVPDPMIKFLVILPPPTTTDANVVSKPLKSTVPAKSVKLPEARVQVKVSCKVYVPPAPLKTTYESEIPAEVSVWLPLPRKENPPVPVTLIPATSVRSPTTVNVFDVDGIFKVGVLVTPVQVVEPTRHEVLTATVFEPAEKLLPLKTIESCGNGSLAPTEPPDEVDHIPPPINS